jgi:hypothetical protein
MTVTLDKVFRIGTFQITALSESAIISEHIAGRVVVAGQKRPVAVLIRQGDVLTAFRPDGLPMTCEQVEGLCVGAWNTALQAR